MLCFVSAYVAVVSVNWWSACVFVLSGELRVMCHRNISSVGQLLRCGILFLACFICPHRVRSCQSTGIPVDVCVIGNTRMLLSEFRKT